MNLKKQLEKNLNKIYELNERIKTVTSSSIQDPTKTSKEVVLQKMEQKQILEQQVRSLEIESSYIEEKLGFKNNREKAKRFCARIKYLNPAAILVYRYQTSSMTKGGILKPTDLVKREGKSTMFGEILRTSKIDTCDQEVMEKKPYIEDGDYGMFLSTNPIRGGLDSVPMLQLIATPDILYSIDEETFNEFIAEDGE